MTETENLDLRAEMTEAIDCFSEAVYYLSDNQFDEAIKLWQAGQQKATLAKIKLVKAKNTSQGED